MRGQSGGAGFAQQPRDRRYLDGRRVKARLIDLVVVWLGVSAIALLAGWDMIVRETYTVEGGTAWRVGMSFEFALLFLFCEVSYFFVCESTWGHTLGKYRMGLSVIRADGGTPGVGAIAARNILRPVEEPVLALIVMVVSTYRRRRLGDLVGGTAVGGLVYAERPRLTPWRFAYLPIWAAGALALGAAGDGGIQPGPPTAPGDAVERAVAVAEQRGDDPQEVRRYIAELSALCAKSVRQNNAIVASRRYGRFVSKTRNETAELRAIRPPVGQVGVHRRMLALQRGIDRAVAATASRASRSRQPMRHWRRLSAQLTRPHLELGGHLNQLGVDC